MDDEFFSSEEVASFYNRLIYGKKTDDIDASINNAYLDFCRTIRGFTKKKKTNGKKKNEHGKKINKRRLTKNKKINTIIKDKASSILKECLENINVKSQDDFDTWHKKTCERLIDAFKGHKVQFHFGQAQKWINMTFKYLAMRKCKRFRNIYQYCHIPIDNVILKSVGYHFKYVAWSRLDRYEDYLNFQKGFRNKELPPLKQELRLWLGQD